MSMLMKLKQKMDYFNLFHSGIFWVVPESDKSC